MQALVAALQPPLGKCDLKKLCQPRGSQRAQRVLVPYDLMLDSGSGAPVLKNELHRRLHTVGYNSRKKQHFSLHQSMVSTDFLDIVINPIMPLLTAFYLPLPAMPLLAAPRK